MGVRGMRRPVSRSSRRFAGIFAAVALTLLVIVPAALGDAISAEAGVPFSGVVDTAQAPGCPSPPTGVSIDWSDGTPADTASGKYIASNGSVSGSHTYAAKGSFFGTVTISGCFGSGSDATDSLTATVTAVPQFTQCPPVGANSGCQFLISVTNTGNLVSTDPNQGPYENSDDSLIGVVNNSSSPI